MAKAQVAINTTGNAPDASAGLDVDFNNKGLLIPRLTTAQRDAISNPANSLLIFNTTTKCFEAYHAASSTWIAFGCIGCQLPGSFSASAASNVTSTSFSANWSAASGATDYYLDVSDNSSFSTYVSGYQNLSVGNVTTYSVTGLTCGTTYYYRVRASNACGTSPNSNTITVITSVCQIYAIGGWNGSSFLATNEEYDPVSNTWTAKAAMPTGMADLAAAVP